MTWRAVEPKNRRSTAGRPRTPSTIPHDVLSAGLSAHRRNASAAGSRSNSAYRYKPGPADTIHRAPSTPMVRPRRRRALRQSSAAGRPGRRRPDRCNQSRRRSRDERDDVLGPALVDRAHAVFTRTAEHDVPEVGSTMPGRSRESRSFSAWHGCVPFGWSAREVSLSEVASEPQPRTTRESPPR
jgi:hypothetical protein